MKYILQKLFLLGIALFSYSSFAGSFSVTPVRIFFTPKDRAVAITLSNDGDTEIALQADINAWSQDSKGNDQLELTEDLILAPPSLKIPPNSKQVVRLALVTPRDASNQMIYRLVVREIPEVAAAKAGTIELPVSLVMSMPVFVTPANAKNNVECISDTSNTVKISVTCSNKGNAYAQLRNISLKRGETVFAVLEGANYLLPGATKQFVLSPEKGQNITPGELELSVQFDDGKSQTYSAPSR